MHDTLDAILDHVAIAVPSWEDGEQRWKHQLGGGVVAWGRTPAFHSRQLRFANGAKLELLAPPPDSGPDNFVRRFLDRFGASVHHVTLKVPDLKEALRVLETHGVEAVDIRMDNAYWQEAFLRPSLVGGLVVQIAYAGQSDEEWAARNGHTPEPARADAASLLGPVLEHPDLAAAERLWTMLGAKTSLQSGDLVCEWPRSPLTVRIVAGPVARTVALRGSGTSALPTDANTGPELRI